MKTIIVASTNPVKIEAARQAFAAMFPSQDFSFTGVAAPSDVSDQPMSSDETLQGARNRVRHAIEIQPNADYWIAFEGGLEEHEGALESVVWTVIKDQTGMTNQARAASFRLPPAVAALVRQGTELGKATDIFFNRIRANHANGSVGILTGDVIDRTQYYVHMAIMALIPFKNPDLYGATAAQAA